MQQVIVGKINRRSEKYEQVLEIEVGKKLLPVRAAVKGLFNQTTILERYAKFSVRTLQAEISR